MAPPDQPIHAGAEPRTSFTTEGLILPAAGSAATLTAPIPLLEPSLTEEGTLPSVLSFPRQTTGVN